MAGSKKTRKLEIKMLGVDDLTPYETNPRTHSKRQIGQIAESIQEYGWTNPILIDPDRGIIAGHCRVEAARLLGMVEVPTITLEGLSEAQRRAYVIADNKYALNSGWDPDLLASEFATLQDLDFDLALTGFDPTEINEIFEAQTGAQEGEDDVPEEPDDPVTQPGDIWILGNHRLLCGDATVASDVEKLLDGVEPHLMCTDPPYGVNYDPDWRNVVDQTIKFDKEGKPRSYMKKGASAIKEVQNDDRADWREAWALFPGDVAYIWCAGNKINEAAEAIIACGFDLRAEIIWVKNQHVIGRGDYHPKHEPLLYAVRQKKKGHYCGGRKQTTVWEIDKPMKSETGHSTQKPVECMRRPILNNSSPGQAVYDPFVGSFTTGIAAETTGRICYGMEIHPAYVDVSISRWEQFAGCDAIHEKTGKTFAELKETRSRIGTKNRVKSVA